MHGEVVEPQKRSCNARALWLIQEVGCGVEVTGPGQDEPVQWV